MTKLRRNRRPASGRRATKRGYTLEIAARMGAQTILQAKSCDVDRLSVYADPRQFTDAMDAA